MVFTISYKNVVLYQEIVSKCQVFFFHYDSLYAGRCNDIQEHFKHLGGCFSHCSLGASIIFLKSLSWGILKVHVCGDHGFNYSSVLTGMLLVLCGFWTRSSMF